MPTEYRHRLVTLTGADFLLPPVARRLCLLTGQSCFRSSLLPPDKRDFLAAIAPRGVEIVPTGFPWHRQFAIPAPAPSLLSASLRNARQWIWARRDARYRAALTAILGRLLAQTREQLLLVTGSCGIDLLAAVLPDLPPGPPIYLVALGPAGRVPVADRLADWVVLQGRRDGWSRLLWRGPVQGRPDCGHLDYYCNADSIARVRAFLAAVPA